MLILRNPLADPNTGLNQILFYTDIVVLMLYFFEIGLKIVAFGFIFNGEGSFIRDLYNFFDFALFVLTLIGTIDSKVQLLPNTNLRVWRCLRILKVLRYSEGLRIAIETLFKAIPQVLQTFAFFSIFFLVFSVVGIKSLKGTHSECSGIAHQIIDDFVFTRSDCFDWGGVWLPKDLNYDNLAQAMATLFQVSTTEEWLDTL